MPVLDNYQYQISLGLIVEEVSVIVIPSIILFCLYERGHVCCCILTNQLITMFIISYQA